MEVEKGKEPKITTLSLRHGDAFYNFKYGEESDGTRRLFDLIDMLLNKSDNMTWGREIRADKRLRDETVDVETDSRYVLTISGLTEVSSKNSLSLFTVSYFLRV